MTFAGSGNTNSSGCNITGTVGIVVQISLAALVAIVLLSEYLFEYCRGRCSTSHHSRTFRTFWFDSYKICTGALVSHVFNVGVSLFVDTTSANADECAVYALAFYYEACGVPFVQLLQYGFIHYALKMSAMGHLNHHSRSHKSMNDHRSHGSANAVLPPNCVKRWQYISEPGVYDANRYPVDDCLHCRSCQDAQTKRSYFKIFVVFMLAIAFSLLAAVVSFFYYGANETYVDFSIGLLVFIFIGTTVIAPVSSLWQTLGWVSVKFVEKLIWSLFAISQAPLFAEWSRSMSTGDPTLDAWVYLAIVPIIMNTFMFFMFSRISRLNLPCFKTADNSRIDTLHQIQSREMTLNNMNRNHHHNNNNNNHHNGGDDKGDLYQQLPNNAMQYNVITEISSSSTDHQNKNKNLMMNNNNMVVSELNRQTYSNASMPSVDSNLNHIRQNVDIPDKFDKREAFKVGIVFMLIINFSLFMIAVAYLIYQGAGATLWTLVLTMIVVPFLCSVVAIHVFAYLIDNNIHVCVWCGGGRGSSRDYYGGGGSAHNNHNSDEKQHSGDQSQKQQEYSNPTIQMQM